MNAQITRTKNSLHNSFSLDYVGAIAIFNLVKIKTSLDIFGSEKYLLVLNIYQLVSCHSDGDFCCLSTTALNIILQAGEAWDRLRGEMFSGTLSEYQSLKIKIKTDVYWSQFRSKLFAKVICRRQKVRLMQPTFATTVKPV